MMPDCHHLVFLIDTGKYNAVKHFLTNIMYGGPHL